MRTGTREQYDRSLKKEPGKLPGSERVVSVASRRRKEFLDAQRRHNQARGLRRGPHKPRFGSKDEAREVLIASILQEVMDDTYKPDMRSKKQKAHDEMHFRFSKMSKDMGKYKKKGLPKKYGYRGVSGIYRSNPHTSHFSSYLQKHHKLSPEMARRVAKDFSSKGLKKGK
jgi:hypothetical protein